VTRRTPNPFARATPAPRIFARATVAPLGGTGSVSARSKRATASAKDTRLEMVLEQLREEGVSESDLEKLAALDWESHYLIRATISDYERDDPDDKRSPISVDTDSTRRVSFVGAARFILAQLVWFAQIGTLREVDVRIWSRPLDGNVASWRPLWQHETIETEDGPKHGTGSVRRYRPRKRGRKKQALGREKRDDHIRRVDRERQKKQRRRETSERYQELFATDPDAAARFLRKSNAAIDAAFRKKKGKR
jgi:hypothetical protein